MVNPGFIVTELFCLACKRAGQLEIRVTDYDNGVDSDTGYHDTGTVVTFVCECGNSGDVEGDLEHVSVCL